MLPANKTVYYNNLADVCTMLGEYERADVHYEKMLQLYTDMKDGKPKQMLRVYMEIAAANAAYRKGEYGRTMDILQANPPKTKGAEVDALMLSARASLALREREAAIRKLRAVIDNGNKLYAVKEAESMLKELCECSSDI